MCTQARIPSPSRRNESASSKSFAVSGSIVKVTRSRRSTRSSRGGSRSSYGSEAPSAPLATSQPSSAASTELASPSTRSTRGRPLPSATTTRSPGRASCAPERSSTTAVPAGRGAPTPRAPGAPLLRSATTTRPPGRASCARERSSTTAAPASKNGSPKTSLPRRATSATRSSKLKGWSAGGGCRPSNLQELAQGQAGAAGTEREPDCEQDPAVQPERHRVHARRAERVRQRIHDRHLREQQDEHGDQRPAQSHDQPLDHERSADEPVRRTDELHHLDLAPPREDREP